MNEAWKPAGTPAPRRRGVIIGVGAAAVLAGAGFAWWRMKQKADTPSAPAIDQAGVQEFWPMEFETPQGTKLTVASLKGKPLLLNFWATWCAPCIEEMPMLDAFYRQNSAKGWQVLGLAIDQPSSVRKFLEQKPVSFPIGLAGFGGTDLTRQLGNMAGGLPFSVLFDPDGRLRQRKMGKLSEADLQAWTASA